MGCIEKFLVALHRRGLDKIIRFQPLAERTDNSVQVECKYILTHTAPRVSFTAILLPAGKLTFSKCFSEHGVKKLGKLQIFIFDIKAVQISCLIQSLKCLGHSTFILNAKVTFA